MRNSTHTTPTSSKSQNSPCSLQPWLLLLHWLSLPWALAWIAQPAQRFLMGCFGLETKPVGFARKCPTKWQWNLLICSKIQLSRMEEVRFWMPLLCTSTNMWVLIPHPNVLFDLLVHRNIWEGSPSGSEFLPHEDKPYRGSMRILYIRRNTRLSSFKELNGGAPINVCTLFSFLTPDSELNLYQYSVNAGRGLHVYQAVRSVILYAIYSSFWVSITTERWALTLSPCWAGTDSWPSATVYPWILLIYRCGHGTIYLGSK